jgi:bifunctional DNA-binding transcriptional regulator/antitoxin component of YhaV-PrlF toxin-antitoxin module
MRITSKGQVTIQADIRKRAGLLPHTMVAFEFDDTEVRIIRTDAASGKDAGPASSPTCVGVAMSQ